MLNLFKPKYSRERSFFYPTGNCPDHEWVAAVERNEDGSFELSYPDSMDPTETIHAIRGQLVTRMVFCRRCGARPEGGERWRFV